MNAMLGMDRLPTGVVPVTSVITAVSYNTRERVMMHFENSNLTHEVPLSELSEWITEQGNPGNKRKIDMAEVQLPAELLRRGAFFVDTPGLGSADDRKHGNDAPISSAHRCAGAGHQL